MNKKNFNKLLVYGSLAFLTIGCRDAIDIVQDGELGNEATFSTMEGITNYLSGAYATIENQVTTDFWNNTPISPYSAIKFTSVFTDELSIGSANAGRDQLLHRFIIENNNGYVESIWLSNYRTIGQLNRIVEGTDDFTPQSTEVAKFKDALAQTKALRAYCYLQLETYFSTDMKDTNALGVILTTGAEQAGSQKPRSTNAEVYALMDADLNYAEENISTDPTSYYFVTKNMIYALKARYYLYRGDHAKAKIYANKVLAESGLSLTVATPLVPSTVTAAIGTTQWNNNFYGTATLNPVNPYRKMWLDRERGEVIFGLSRPAVTNTTWANIAGIYTTNSTTAGGSPFFELGRKLFNLLKDSSGDIRRYAFVDPTSTPQDDYVNNQAKDVLIIDKYPGKLGTTFILRNDVKIFRLSEMYFILAECAVAENNLSTAAVLIKSVRDARNYLGTTTLPVYANSKEAYADILKERRVELSFEGHRYIDLKRIGQLAGVAIDRDITDDIVTTLPTSIPYDYRFTLPIPLSELQANPQIQQNPGY